MRFADHAGWSRVLSVIPAVVPTHRMRGVVLAIAAGCVAHIAQTEMPPTIASEDWSERRIALIVEGIMTITMNRYERVAAALEFQIAHAIADFSVTFDPRDIERAIEQAMLHGGDTELAAYLLARAFSSGSHPSN